MDGQHAFKIQCLADMTIAAVAVEGCLNPTLEVHGLLVPPGCARTATTMGVLVAAQQPYTIAIRKAPRITIGQCVQWEQDASAACGADIGIETCCQQPAALKVIALPAACGAGSDCSEAVSRGPSARASQLLVGANARENAITRTGPNPSSRLSTCDRKPDLNIFEEILAS